VVEPVLEDGDVDAGCGDGGANTHDDEHEEGEDYAIAEFRDFEGVGKGGNHAGGKYEG